MNMQSLLGTYNLAQCALFNIYRLFIQRTRCNALYTPQWLQQNNALKSLRVNQLNIQYSEPQTNCQALRVCVRAVLLALI